MLVVPAVVFVEEEGVTAGFFFGIRVGDTISRISRAPSDWISSMSCGWIKASFVSSFFDSVVSVEVFRDGVVLELKRFLFRTSAS